MDYLVWTLTVACVVLGLAGTVLPVLPGPGLIASAVLAHKLLLPEILSWWTVAFCLALALAALLLDWAGGAIGAKWFGSTKWGVLGAVIGGIIGLGFGLPGLLLGPLLGVLLGELLFAGKTFWQSGKITVGVAVTLVLTVFVKLGLALLMTLAFAANVAWHYWRN
jgi:uncharacterized protein YqgC (DUF456 family)